MSSCRYSFINDLGSSGLSSGVASKSPDKMIIRYRYLLVYSVQYRYRTGTSSLLLTRKNMPVNRYRYRYVQVIFYTGTGTTNTKIKCLDPEEYRYLKSRVFCFVQDVPTRYKPYKQAMNLCISDVLRCKSVILLQLCLLKFTNRTNWIITLVFYQCSGSGDRSGSAWSVGFLALGSESVFFSRIRIRIRVLFAKNGNSV
jgi:hypothetical protein